MTRLLFSVVLLLISLNVNAYDKFTIISTGILLTDWAQTHEIVNDPERREKNPYLGKYPSHSKLNKYFATAILLNYLVGDVLLKKKRNIRHLYYLQFIGIQGLNIANNHRQGVRIKFNRIF